jgi:hypothetical protein
MAEIHELVKLLERRDIHGYTVHRHDRFIYVSFSKDDSALIEDLRQTVKSEPFNYRSIRFFNDAETLLHTEQLREQAKVSFLDLSHGETDFAARAARRQAVFLVIDTKQPESSLASGDENASYDTDFALWSRSQARILRERLWDQLDVENAAEEMEDLSKREHRELRSRLRVLIMHLLKWDYQPAQRSGSWVATVIEQRAQIQDLLSDSPSLQQVIEAYAAESYETARDEAVAETGLPPDDFPPGTPYTVDQLLTVQLRKE